MNNLNPSQIQRTNAIMFADGETWYVVGKPDAAFSTILKDWKKCGGNNSVTSEYPGLQFGIITATVQQYADHMTTGLKDFFAPAIEVH